MPDAKPPEDEPSPTPWERHRRTILLGSSGAMLLAGVLINGAFFTMHSYDAPAPPSLQTESMLAEQRYVSYMQAGEEGKMGKPSAEPRGGLYAMKMPAEPQEVALREAVSTFSIDVDTAAYATVRHALEHHHWPDPALVRTEELINYFTYDYPAPDDGLPMSVTTEVGACPWSDEHRLVHIGLQGVAPSDEPPPRNLVFLIDVSGSMGTREKLPLLKAAMAKLTSELTDDDEVAIVVYAGAAGMVLDRTDGDDKDEIYDAIAELEAGGSTNGGEGIQLAYRLAEAMAEPGAVNRVLLATDGDFNVGVTDEQALIELIEEKRRSGVFLSVLRFGAPGLSDGTMEQLADHGNGNYAYIDRLAEAHKVLGFEASATLQTVAKDVKLQVQFDRSNVLDYELVGYDNRVLANSEFRDDKVDAGELGAGQSVTALYQVRLRDDAVSPGVVRMRYKSPQSERGTEHEWSIAAGSRDSENLGFSAAVAEFAGLLRDEEPVSGEAFARVHAQALEHRGDDPYCLRAEFVRLVESAAALRSHPLSPANIECETTWDDVDLTELAPTDYSGFVVGVLRLLPPLLALPLFVMGLRRPRRRRHG